MQGGDCRPWIPSRPFLVGGIARDATQATVIHEGSQVVAKRSARSSGCRRVRENLEFRRIPLRRARTFPATSP